MTEANGYLTDAARQQIRDVSKKYYADLEAKRLAHRAKMDEYIAGFKARCAARRAARRAARETGGAA